MKGLVTFLAILAMLFAFTSCKKKGDTPVEPPVVESEYSLEADGKDEKNND